MLFSINYLNYFLLDLFELLVNFNDITYVGKCKNLLIKNGKKKLEFV